MFQTRKLNPDAKIYFLTDDEVTPSIQEQIGITLVPFSKDDFPHVRLLNEVAEFKHLVGFGNNPFWFITFIRYMMCEYLCDRFNLDSFCFIEGDNLIYFNVDEIMNQYCQNSLSVCNETVPGNYCSGMYFCSNIQTLRELNDFNLEKLKGGVRGYTDMNSIFAFQQSSKSLTILPGLPFDTQGNLLFDMLGYGQFLGGENHRRQNSYIDPNHRLTKLLISKYEYGKDFDIFKGDRCFNLRFMDKTYDLFNIHAHNKANFDKFFNYVEEYKNCVIK